MTGITIFMETRVPSAESTPSCPAMASSTELLSSMSPRTTRKRSCENRIFAGSRANAVTTCPCCSACCTSRLPVPPVAPNTRSFMGVVASPPGTSSVSLSLGGWHAAGDVDDFRELRRQRVPCRPAEARQELLLSRHPVGSRLDNFAATPSGDGHRLGTSRPVAERDEPLAAQGFEGAMERGPLEHQLTGERGERHRVAVPLEAAQDGELCGGESRAREAGIVHTGDRSRGAP